MSAKSILDFHVHMRLAGSEHSWESILETARRSGITHLVELGDVLRFGAQPSPDQIKAINDDTLEIVRRWPDNVAGFCFLNPRNPADFTMSEIKRCRVGLSGGLSGIKLEISERANHRSVHEIAAEARRRGVPLLQHAWDTRISGHYSGDMVTSSPLDIAELARNFPDLKIVMAHLSGVGCAGVLEVKNLPNVWVDTSGGQPFAGFVEYAVRKLGPERVLFGSDASGRDFGVQLARVTGANLPADIKRKITLDNGLGLLARNKSWGK